MHDEMLIASLHALADVDVPVSPTFSAAVTGRVARLPAPATTRHRRIAARLVAALIAAVLVVLPGPRAAFARWLGIGSVRIERGSTGDDRDVLPRRVRDLDLGVASSFDEAQQSLGHQPFVVPGRSPIGVWVQTIAPSSAVQVGTVQVDTVQGDTVQVNTVYVEGDRTILVSELPGPGDVFVSKKLAADGAQLEFLTVRSKPAVWFGGAPHEVAFLDRDGAIVTSTVRLAGPVLLWADDSRTIRIEGLTDRAEAVAFLERLQPRA